MSSYDVKHAQEIVLGVFRSFRDQLLEVSGAIAFDRKTDASPVTQWDVAVETALQEALRQYDASIGFYGEETGVSGDTERYWIVDPIDGTTGFIRGFDYSTNMAAYVEGGEVQAAVIYDFYRNHAYTAVRGEGAYRDGTRLHIATERREGNLLVYSFTRRKFAHFQEALEALGTRTILPMGHAGHTYILLAEGKIDGAINLMTTMGMHDNAPGVLLCEEAGAVVVPYDDKTGVERHDFIIGSPYLIELIERSGLI